MSTNEQPRPPFPPFNAETATQKVRLAEDAWNTRDPLRVSMAVRASPAPKVRRAAFLRAGLVVIMVLALDQLTKHLVKRHGASFGPGSGKGLLSQLGAGGSN